MRGKVHLVGTDGAPIGGCLEPIGTLRSDDEDASGYICSRCQKALEKLIGGCRVRANHCDEHGYVHGAEAEELRAGLEKALSNLGTDCCRHDDDLASEIRNLLDYVDARDSLAYCEAMAKKARKR